MLRLQAEAMAWDDFSAWWPTRLLNVVRRDPSTGAWAVAQQLEVVNPQRSDWSPGDPLVRDRVFNDFGKSGLSVTADSLAVGAPAWGGPMPGVGGGLNTGTPAVYMLEFQCALGMAYETAAATADQSATCTLATVCTATEYESVTPT